MKAQPEPGADALDVLAHGEIEMLGVLPYASNYTYLVRVRKGDVDALAVYKPRRGERPLWDFTHGTLGRREVAAYLLSSMTGWDLVPPTVLREDGPLGDGSLQWFVAHDPERHYLSLAGERTGRFAIFAAFDIVVNNADRKSGHVLEDASGHLWGVDHGLTFHVEPKLRTVIWEFAHTPLPDEVRLLLRRTRDALADPVGLGGRIAQLLSEPEAAAAGTRTEGLLALGEFPPAAEGYRALPWPLI